MENPGFYPTLAQSGLTFTLRALTVFAPEFKRAAAQEAECGRCRRERLSDCPHSPKGYREVLGGLSAPDSPYFGLLACPLRDLDRRSRHEGYVQSRCGLTGDELAASFEGFEPGGNGDALAQARDYAASFSRETRHGLLFYGTYGTGKTHLAAAILNTLVSRGFTPQAVNVADLSNLYRASFGEEAASLRGQLQGLERADLLLLDDWGQEKPSDAFRAVMYNLVNNRIRHNRPMLLTSNLTMEALLDHVGAPLYSRLLGALDPVRMVGEDYRRRLALARQAAQSRRDLP